MDSIPFLHAGRLFTIFFVEDLAFAEVRAILDDLLASGAFDPTFRQDTDRYLIELEHASFNVWVASTDVFIQKE